MTTGPVMSAPATSAPVMIVRGTTARVRSDPKAVAATAGVNATNAVNARSAPPPKRRATRWP